MPPTVTTCATESGRRRPSAGLHGFSEGRDALGFRFEEHLADELTALGMDAIRPEDTLLRIEVGGGTLLFADSLINYGELVLSPTS